MADNVTLTRVIDLVAQSSISDGDYTIIDSLNGGTKRYNLGSLAEQISEGGLTEEIKQAILQIAAKVVYTDDQGPTYYQALYDAFYPPTDLVSISAVYTQSGTVYDTDTLDSLKTDLVVTAHYRDDTSETVTTYVLSGTLTMGTSTITVSYGGKTASFTVSVKDENYYRSLTDGTLAPLQQGSISTVDGIPVVSHKNYQSQVYDAYVINILEGVIPFNERDIKDVSEITVSDFYPIPIPSDATTAVITVDESTIEVNGTIRKYENDVFTIIGSSQSHQGSISFSFESSENLYFVGMVRNVGTATINNVTVEFS